jgi:Pyruvate/2-oxoacid:ferredoxin oxidoreductase gamma subunit
MLGAFAAVDDLVGIEAVLKAVDKGMPENLRAKNKKAVERAHRMIRGEK